jgi:hypothetical protein
LTDHLDLLVSVGGKYVRNTMSDRDDGNIYAFGQIEDGMYDLDQWNNAYWDRLEFLLNESEKRGIIVQLTLWDQFDLGSSEWQEHPWNPENNVNMETGAWDDREGIIKKRPPLIWYIKVLPTLTKSKGDLL